MPLGLEWPLEADRITRRFDRLPGVVILKLGSASAKCDRRP
jgi:hypothetical protein